MSTSTSTSSSRTRSCFSPSPRHPWPWCRPGSTRSAGLELGGIPLATMMSQLTSLPTRFVRKQAKTYGTCRLAEGGELEGQRLCIIEDVVTSGGAILDAAVELRARGRGARTRCLRDRSGVGRRGEARSRGPRPPPAVPDARADRVTIRSRLYAARFQQCSLRLQLGRRRIAVHTQPGVAEAGAHVVDHARRRRTATNPRRRAGPSARRRRIRSPHSRTPRLR